MTAEHEYLSTACWHELNDGRPELHAKCRAICKYGDTPEMCRCRNHVEGETRTESEIDRARGLALRLLAAVDTAGVDLAVVDRRLARAITEDPSLFWLRGEEQPPGEWRDAIKEETA